MRGLPLLVLLVAGCQAGPSSIGVDAPAEQPWPHATLDVLPNEPCAPAHEISGSVTLPQLWNLALAHNPVLREAVAEVEIARGNLIQAGKYPNPRFSYEGEEIGTSQSAAGTQRFQ